MAIIKSATIGKAKGSIDNITYAYVGGDTIAKGKIAFPKNPRTNRQMRRRVAWPNLVNLWQAFEGLDHPSFELAIGRVSDYNLFMSRNINGNQVYLQKDQAQQGASVVAGYLMSEGSIPAIDTQIANGVGKSDISLGTLVIDEETTVADFSNAVIQNNSDYENGDQISCFLFEQRVNSVTGIPYVKVRGSKLVLDSDNINELLADVVSPEAFSIVDNKLGTGAAVQGGVCYIHSRVTAHGTEVSTQNIVVANSILANYQSDASRTAAIISYGGNVQREFLTPDLDEIVAPV